MAAARRISGTQSGAVILVTSTSPSWNCPASASEPRTHTGPLAEPGAAPSPRSRIVRAGSTDVAAACPTAVTGRDCSIQVVPSRSIAHSVSCAAP